jgi:thiol:disulfide interchange protein DsbD
MPRIECAGCGFVLAVPDELREGAGFTCAHCGLIARNVESARRFHWAELDPYVRRHGVSRGNLWGGTIGSLAWLPVLGVVLALQGRFDLGLFVALAAPYLFLLAVLKQRRPRTPALLWATHLWIGLGLYLLYLWLLISFFPGWAGVLLDSSGAGGGGVMPSMLVAMGATCVLVGTGISWSYRVRARRLPRATGTAPMALLALLCALVGLLGSCADTQPESAAKVFSTLPYEQAVAQAQSEHMLLLVDATASWCPPCRKMEETTWPDEKIVAWLGGHAIAVQVDVDRQPALAQKLGIQAMPTLIVSKDGAELARVTGYRSPGDLMTWLESVHGP